MCRGKFKAQLRLFLGIFLVFSSLIPQILTDQLFLEGHLLVLDLLKACLQMQYAPGLNNDISCTWKCVKTKISCFSFCKFPLWPMNSSFELFVKNEFCVIRLVSRISSLILQLLSCQLKGCQ